MSAPASVPRATNQGYVILGLALTVAGLAGHLFAARSIGGTYVAYRDHIRGFLGIAVITGGILALAGWCFWRGRRDVTVLIFGALQAMFGLFVYVERFGIHS